MHTHHYILSCMYTACFTYYTCTVRVQYTPVKLIVTISGSVVVDIQDSSNYVYSPLYINFYVYNMFHTLYSQSTTHSSKTIVTICGTSATYHLRSECRWVASEAYKVLLVYSDVFEVQFEIKRLSMCISLSLPCILQSVISMLCGLL